MANKPRDEKLKEIIKQANLAWKWLRNYSDYKNDFNKYSKIKNIPQPIRNQLYKKWGFFPLYSYQEKNASFEFITQFMDLYPPHVYLDHATIVPSGSNSYYPTRTSSDSKLTFGINLRMPTGIIVNEISKLLTRLKTDHKIKTIEPRYYDLADMYKVRVLTISGKNKHEIKQLIKKNCPVNPVGADPREAYSKQASRKINKFSATSLKT